MNKNQSEMLVGILNSIKDFKSYYFLCTLDIRRKYVIVAISSEADEYILKSPVDVSEFVQTNITKARMHNALS